MMKYAPYIKEDFPHCIVAFREVRKRTIFGTIHYWGIDMLSNVQVFNDDVYHCEAANHYYKTNTSDCHHIVWVH